MLIAELVKGPMGGRYVGATVHRKHFILIDGKPSRYIAQDGTLRGVRGYVWGKSKADLRRMAQAR